MPSGLGTPQPVIMGKDDLPLKMSFQLNSHHLTDNHLTGATTNTTSLAIDESSGNPYSNDIRDMDRMGRAQQVKRVFRSWSLLAFTCINTSTWEYLMLGNDTALTCGGRAGLFWSYIWCFILFGFLSASIAEMASMAPTAGGQYHWVSEFAPARYQKFLSYLVGWLCLLSWMAGNAYGFLLSGSLLESIIMVFRPDYEIVAWRSMLMAIPMLVVAAAFNVGLARGLPLLQNMTMIVHIVGAILIMVTLWVVAPHVHVSDVIVKFENSSGWSNWFVIIMIGQLNAQGALASSDSAVHMAEEVKDAGMAVPKAIMNALYLNGGIGFLMMVSFLFAMPSVSDALGDDAGTFFYVIKTAWPTVGYTYFLFIIWVLISLGNIPFSASCGRLTFALARDGGLPFPKFFSRIHPKFQVPVNAILLGSGIAFALNLINLGSATAFNTIISLAAVAQMCCYCVSIACMLWRRTTRPETLPPARWSLGKYGVLINAIGFCFCTTMAFWSAWPSSVPVQLDTVNLSGPVTIVTALICTITYFVYGRRVYVSPVELVKKR